MDESSRRSPSIRQLKLDPDTFRGLWEAGCQKMEQLLRATDAYLHRIFRGKNTDEVEAMILEIDTKLAMVGHPNQRVRS